MKKKEERKKWKGLKNGFLLMGFIALLIASSQTVRAEEINWLKAAEIAKRYVTLPQNDHFVCANVKLCNSFIPRNQANVNDNSWYISRNTVDLYRCTNPNVRKYAK